MWREVTEDDLTSALSRAEVEAFRRSADSGAEPVDALVKAEVQFVQGCIRSGGLCKVPAEGAGRMLPESLVIPAMNHLRFQLLSRMDVVVNESRRYACERAEELFGMLRRGEFAPEPFEDEEDSSKAVSPASGEPRPPRRLD